MQTRLATSLRWLLARSRWLPLPVSVIYLVSWIVGEAGRYAIVEKTVVFTLFAVAIAFSGLWPLVSLGIVTAIPVLQLGGVLYPPTSTTWPTYAAAGFVALMVAFRGEGWSRRLVIPAGLLVSLLFAVRLISPGPEGYWVDWVGYGDGFDGIVAISTNSVTYGVYPNRDAFIGLLIGALVFYFGMWAIGYAMRSLLRVRAIGHVLVAAEDRLQETDFELRLAEDRARISRDVHDALAHSLAVIVSQAEGALALQGQRPQVAGGALTNIAAVGRVALTDVRSLVERIHDEDLTAIAPSIEDLPDVIARMRTVGMDATLQVLGEPDDLPASRDLAVFRIVQESLTNALKHGGAASTARVTLDWQGAGLAILVVSTPGGEPTTPHPSRGVGIEGMKERAHLAGGWLSAERDGSDFRVTAYIPTEARTGSLEVIRG
jgi:signal transduction histidine kinase